MNQIKTTILLLLLCLPVIAISGKPTVIPEQWIVELEHQPTLQFRGATHLPDDALTLEVAGFSPTAPEGGRFDPMALHVREYVDFLDRSRADVLSLGGNLLGREVSPKGVYRHVLNGFSIRMTPEEAERFSELPGVRAVRQDLAWELELDRGPEVIGATTVWSDLGELSTRGEGVVVGIIDTGINWDHIYFSDDPADTGGYQFSNPLGVQLGECSKVSVPCNNKLIGVWDFTEEGTNGRDPESEGHGTHVASTAVGNPLTFSLGDTEGTFATSGVAPRANVVSYKVCYGEDFDDDDLAGKCVGSAITQALEQVIQDGVDVVNYSIGGDANDPWASSRPFLNVRNAGILFVTSAGNSGPEAGSITSPANAPWALAVGSTTHGRRIGNRADVASEDNLFMQPGTGPDFETDISAPIVAADDAGSSLEGCSSFPAGAFGNAIAFMRRGSCTFQTKVENAQAAGAVAVLVFNHESGGGAITMAGLEGTTIPAGMLDNEQGLKARAAIQSTGNPQATLFEARQALINPDWQDRVSVFSSRGPGANAPGVMKPNVMAPGQSILAGYVPDDNSIAIISGTSMAGPHVAGAAALLKSMHPNWGPDILHSALETTAQSDPVQVGTRAGTQVERGAGRIRVDRAARIGLYLPISGADFDASNPANGGKPEQLNLPGIHSLNCAEVCTFVRTVRALSAGSWSVTTEGDLGISVSPQSFSLQAGGQRTLTIEVQPGTSLLGEFGDGAVVLTPSNGSVEAQRLPVGVLSVFADLPDQLSITAPNNRGSAILGVPSAGEMIEPVFRSSPLIRPDRHTLGLREDLIPDDPYSGGQGTETILIDVPADALLLHAEVVEATAPDIDLFVGRDDNSDGEAELDEEVCRSTSPDELEDCVIALPEAGTWWVVVQNWEASSSSATDRVELDLAVLSEAEDASLVAVGPGRHDGGPLEIGVHYEQPAMKINERWIGAVGISSIPEELADVGVVPVKVRRLIEKSPQPTALFPGETRAVVIGGNTSDDLTYFDVPPGAQQVSVSVQGDGSVSAELQRMGFGEVVNAAPDTPPAQGAVKATGSGAAAGFEMTASAEAGRWYVVLENDSTQEARVDITVEISQSTRTEPQFGLWASTTRNNAQGWEWNRGGDLGFMLWYTYDEAGLPVFYLTDALEGDETSSTWTAPLMRFTSTGARQLPDLVGQLSLTTISPTEAIVAWRVEGHHGSEQIVPIVDTTCPVIGGETLDLQGTWFVAEAKEGGSSIAITDSAQSWIRYYFDQLGNGRWVQAAGSDAGPETTELEVFDFRGSHPNSGSNDFDFESVGFMIREFSSDTVVAEQLEFVGRAPLNTDYSSERDLHRLSSIRECQ